LLIGLALAAGVAYCNATSSARLAAVYPSSGGTYVYGRERLGHMWGFLAGWGFVIGKTASCAAMALTFGSYAAPELTRLLAIGAVAVLTCVNLRAVQKTAWLTRAIVVIVVGALALVVAAALTTDPTGANVGPLTEGGARGVLQAAALLFFAFAGYARIATLGEEVRDPVRTIPRAIPLALGIALVIYTIVDLAALLAVGPDAITSSAAPLTTVAEAGRIALATPAVRTGAIVGSLGVLLSLLVGVSRTSFAMAGEGDLPSWLSAVHPERRVPHRAELAVAVAVVAVILVADVRGAIGFSSFAVLFYYGVANASAFTLTGAERPWLRAVSVTGLIGCITLAISLPAASVVGGTALLAIGAAVWFIRQRHIPTATGQRTRGAE
jgi:APA family basic amino acid/polyamine antiporter